MEAVISGPPKFFWVHLSQFFFCFVLFNYYLEFSFLFHFSLSLLIIIDDYIFSLGGGKGFCVPDSLLALFGYLQGSRHLSLVGSLPIPRSVPHYLYICLSEICGCFFPLYQKTKTNSHTHPTYTYITRFIGKAGRQRREKQWLYTFMS